MPRIAARAHTLEFAPAQPYGGEYRVDTPQGTTTGTYRDERPGPHRNGYEGTTPRCQRFFC